MWCAGCNADVAVDVSPETSRARCTACGRDLAMTSIRQDALSRIDAGPHDIGQSPPRPHVSTDPLLATIQNSSAGISAQMSHSVTDARQLLERWTRENILDPQGTKFPRSLETSAASPSTDTQEVAEIPRATTPTPIGGASVETPSSPKHERSRSISIPDLAKPDVITKIVTDATKSPRPSQPVIELPPPVPHVSTSKGDETQRTTQEPDESDEASGERAASNDNDILTRSIRGPKFADRQRLKTPNTAAIPRDEVAESTAEVSPESPTIVAAHDSTPIEDDRQAQVGAENHAEYNEPSETSNDVTETFAAKALAKKPKFRFDASHPSPGDQSLLDMAFSTPTRDGLEESPHPQLRADFFLPHGSVHVTREVHAPHPQLAGVHFDVQSMIQAHNDEKPRQSTQSIFGQILAYLGVGVLTLGAGCVLWGYFGAAQYSHLAPTGWLITTAGQMLLFLGVVTLIAGGLEQTNTLVNARLDHWERKWMEFNGRTYRADPPTVQPMGQGPHIPVDAFQDARSHSEASHSSESRM